MPAMSLGSFLLSRGAGCLLAEQNPRSPSFTATGSRHGLPSPLLGWGGTLCGADLSGLHVPIMSLDLPSTSHICYAPGIK